MGKWYERESPGSLFPSIVKYLSMQLLIRIIEVYMHKCKPNYILQDLYP